MYWIKEKDTICRLYKGARETLGHMLQDCKELKRENVIIRRDAKERRRNGVDAYGSGKKEKRESPRRRKEAKQKHNFELIGGLSGPG